LYGSRKVATKPGKGHEKIPDRPHLSTPGRLSGWHVQAQNFPRLAFGGDLERAAADFAIRREALKRHARIHQDFENLPAKRALDRSGNFHGTTLPAGREKTTRGGAQKS
jgi:hypothetical protein